MDVNGLKAEIKRNGYTLQETAGLIGISTSTFWRKLRNNTLDLCEAEKLIQVLNIQNPGQIFFGGN